MSSITAPATATATAKTALDAALESLRLDGAIFFRSEFSEPWAYESRPPEKIAAALHPGAQRLIMFHIVARGRCWIDVGDGMRQWAEAGDVIVMPYGDQHTVGGMAAAEPVPIANLVGYPPWKQLPVLQYGGGGDPTDIVCGYLYSTNPLFEPSLNALPHLMVARLIDQPAAQWVQASIDYAVAMSQASLPATTTSTRLPELLLIEVLRAHLASAPAIDNGWIGALSDPVLAPALTSIHRDPGHKWTLAELASESGVSRSALDERFRRVLGRSPVRYLTEWRMHVAGEQLRASPTTVFHVARAVGYDSQEAFSRAFKRHHGQAPSHWRGSAGSGRERPA